MGKSKSIEILYVLRATPIFFKLSNEQDIKIIK